MARFFNPIKSVKNQTHPAKKIDIILVDYGSQKQSIDFMNKIVKRFNLKKIAKKYKTFTWEMFKKNFQEDIIERFLGKNQILQKLVSGEANLNKIIYGTMFKINEVIHSEGYPGYQISLQFPCNVDPQRVKPGRSTQNGG